jgi:hypothetical protein
VGRMWQSSLHDGEQEAEKREYRKGTEHDTAP